ncbi:MAG TPA: fibronectin type III-like domain-contianing protein [Anaeromyxobacter sp.]|nr:fibronectin type III-like domain-contianing protein [Anaeromyxobacter sp.]
MGYRYYDKLGVKVRYPFGHGLSYSTFQYDRLHVEHEGGGVTVTFEISNTGPVTGTAVPQVYVGPAPGVPAYVQQAVHALRGFERVVLPPGEVRQVRIPLAGRSFEYWDSPSQSWRRGYGKRQIWVGESVGDLRLTGAVEVN